MASIWKCQLLCYNSWCDASLSLHFPKAGGLSPLPCRILQAIQKEGEQRRPVSEPGGGWQTAEGWGHTPQGLVLAQTLRFLSLRKLVPCKRKTKGNRGKQSGRNKIIPGGKLKQHKWLDSEIGNLTSLK